MERGQIPVTESWVFEYEVGAYLLGDDRTHNTSMEISTQRV